MWEGKFPTSQAHTRRESVVGHWSMGERVVVALVKFGASSKLEHFLECREPYVVRLYKVRVLPVYFISGNRHALSIRPLPVPLPGPPAALPGTYLRIVRGTEAPGLLCHYF